MIYIEKVYKSYGSKSLFDQVDFNIENRERIGLVGSNGCGKSTLLRMISGKENSNSGNIIIPKNYLVGYIEQNIKFKHLTTIEEGMSNVIKAKIKDEWKIIKILSGLGFSERDMKKNPNELSEGFQIKLNLAKILFLEPNLLLLDEPTNYLDIISTRWVENFLLNWPNEIILVTHNRSFMDKIVTHTLGIHRKKIKKIKGITKNYYKYITRVEEIYEKTRINNEKKNKRIISFIDKFRAKARLAGMVQSRIKKISKENKMSKLEKIKTLGFSFNYKQFRPQNMLNVCNLSFAYPEEKFLFKNLNFSIKNGDRICIIGKNGKGKTTLLKILANVMRTTDGNINYNPQIKKGLFSRARANALNNCRTIEEEIFYSSEDIGHRDAKSICGKMMFEGDESLKKINILSGGEKSRVLLGKLLVTPLNLLLLDEPTNHLDMDASDALLTALENFDGGIVMATHNETFLYALAKRLIVFDDNEVFLFEGGYKYFLEKIGWDKKKSFNKTKNTSSKNLTKKDMRRIKSEILFKKSKIISPIKKEIIFLENKIIEKEHEIKVSHGELINACHYSDSIKIKKLSQQIDKYEKIIENLFKNLEKLDNKLNKMEKEFEFKLLESKNK